MSIWRILALALAWACGLHGSKPWQRLLWLSGRFQQHCRALLSIAQFLLDIVLAGEKVGSLRGTKAAEGYLPGLCGVWQ